MFVRKCFRTIASCMAVILSMVTLTGCSAASEEQVVSSNAGGTEISFSWWGNDPRHQYTMNGVDIFMEQNPDINVDYSYSIWSGYENRNKVLMNSRTESDVMQINFAWLSQYSDDGEGYYDLKELSDYIDLSQFSEEDLAFGMKNGKLNALPIAFNTTIFFYNKDIWDSYGLSFPENWGDLFSAAKVMSKDGVYPLGAVKKHAFLMLIAYEEQQSGMPMFDENNKLNFGDKELEDMLLMYNRLLDEKVLMPLEDYDRDALKNGKAASCMCWISDASNYCGAMAEGGGHPEVYGQIIDEGSKRTGWYIKPSTMYAISKYTEHPEEAARLVDYLLNSKDMAELQKTEKGIPVSHAALEVVKNMEDGMSGYEVGASEYMTSHIDQMNLIQTPLEEGAIMDTFKSGGDDYMYDKGSLEDVIKQMHLDIEKILEEKK